MPGHRAPHVPVRLLPHGERTGMTAPTATLPWGPSTTRGRWQTWPAPSTHAESKGVPCHARPEYPGAPSTPGSETGREAPRHSEGTAPPINAYAAPSPPSSRPGVPPAGGADCPSRPTKRGTSATTTKTERSRADLNTHTHATGAQQDEQHTDSRHTTGRADQQHDSITTQHINTMHDHATL